MSENIRETKTLATPGGKELVVKAWLTARERNAVRNVMVSGVSFENAVAGKAGSTEITGELLDRFQHAAILNAVVSYDGSGDMVLERLLDGRAEEYDFAVEAAVAAADFKPAK